METLNRIFIVDDDALVRNALAREINRLKYGTSTEEFGSPIDALLALDSEHESVRIIFSDHLMPDMDGLEFLRIVGERYPHIVSILMTGNIADQPASASPPVGVFKLLSKPWNHEELSNSLNEADALSATRRAK